ncbi:MAG: helix-turn-helix domain-containing protein [Lentisphaeria bacterium]|nr:helix-turn-helix domain-containing protein [Lentisphaeria bacterium]MCH2177081.1 helix-turn-helix domain-containing protein [Lentisphaeria bacterium]
MKKQHVRLTDEDKLLLEELRSKGNTTSKANNRALALIELNKGKSYKEVSKLVNKTQQTVSTWAKKYKKSRLDFLQDQPRSGRPIEIGAESRAKITALACSKPPEGRSQWSLRLLADRAVELNYCDHLSHNHAGDILKKTN